jgi:hypothetical protein
LRIIQEGGVKEIRGNIHLFFRADSGNFESTILRELGAYFKVDTLELITNAGLVGTVDKNMNVIPGEAWRIRNRLLLLDEFNVEGDSSCIQPLLSLLEDQKYKKAIGRMANEQKEVDGDLYFEVKKGEMRMKSRFSCVICSMRKIEKNRSVNIDALLSRCIVIPYSLGNNEIEYVMNGHSLLKIKKCPFKKPFDFTIKAKDYKRIMESVKAYPGFDMQRQFPRIVGDCCRAFAVLGKHDDSTYYLITKLHQEA